MKTKIIEDRDQETLNNDFIKELDKINSFGVVVHHSTFFDRLDEKHKALICYYD